MLFLKVVYIHLSVISSHGNGPTQGKRKTLIHNKSFKCLDLIRFYYGGIEVQTKNKCSINLNISVQKYSFKFKIFRSNRENCVPAQNLINKVFKKLRRQLQRKHHIKIELCVKLSLLRLFHVDHVVQNRRTALTLAWYEWFSWKAKSERFTTASSRWCQSFKYENFTSSFSRLRYNIATKSVQLSSTLKLPNDPKNPVKNVSVLLQRIISHEEHWLT